MVQNYSPLSGKRHHAEKGKCQATDEPANSLVSPSGQRPQYAQHPSVRDEPGNMRQAPILQTLMEQCDIDSDRVLYFDISGRLFMATKTHPQPYEMQIKDIFTRSFIRRYIDTLQDSDDEDAPSCADQKSRAGTRGSRHSPYTRTKRTKRGKVSTSTLLLNRKRRSTKSNRRAARRMHDEDSEEDFELNVVDELELAETEMKPVKVGEVQVVYYDKAFRSINQIACKYIGKRWLKTCHPKKQTSNPYNGGKLGKESMEKFGYMGGLTKPDYWPSDHGWRSGQGCRHREPDHVKKLERLLLLRHLLTCGHKSFTLDKLKRSVEGIEDVYPKYFKTKEVERLKEIFYVRAKELQYLNGEIDGDTEILVMMAKPLAKGRKASKLEDVARVKGESCHELSAEPRPPRLGSTAHIAPVANSHVVGVGSEGDDLHATMEVHTCDPCDFEEEPSSVEDTVPDQSTLGTHYNEARAFQHGVPANPLNLSFENPWSPSLAFAREPSAHDHSLPVQGLNDSLQRTLQYRYKPASMDPSQTASSRRNSAMYMAERNQVTRMSNLRNNPLGSPRAPSQDKTEQAYKSVFSGSVSELDFGTDSDWQTTNMWDTSQFASDSSAYTGFNNPNVSITSIQDSDSGGYSNSSFGSGQMDTWSQGNPNMGPFHYQGWEEGIQQTLRLQANSASRYFATSPQSTYGNPNLQARPS